MKREDIFNNLKSYINFEKLGLSDYVAGVVLK